jgi:hypothetical protein
MICHHCRNSLLYESHTEIDFKTPCAIHNSIVRGDYRNSWDNISSGNSRYNGHQIGQHIITINKRTNRRIALLLFLSWLNLFLANPRRLVQFVERGGYWQSKISSTKYCGACMTKGIRAELKFDSENLWQCLNCKAHFSPHS